MSGGTITNRLRRLRFDAGEMTQQELADRAGVTRQTVIAIEAGRYSPSLEVAFRLARAFGLGVDAVFSYEPASSERADWSDEHGREAEQKLKIT